MKQITELRTESELKTLIQFAIKELIAIEKNFDKFITDYSLKEITTIESDLEDLIIDISDPS